MFTIFVDNIVTLQAGTPMDDGSQLSDLAESVSGLCRCCQIPVVFNHNHTQSMEVDFFSLKQVGWKECKELLSE